jgi:HAD superfamily hydrolase (TIGR01509 family)
MEQQGFNSEYQGKRLSMATKRSGVLFDVDGTLVDTNYLHTLAWSRALIDVGEWAPMNAIHRLVGMGGDQLVPRLLGHEVAGAGDARSERYAELAGEIRAFPGAAQLLRAVHAAGLVVVLATSSPPEEVERALAVIGLEDRVIDAVTTSDDVEESKPAPDIFAAALAAGDVDPGMALAVGDSVWDLQAARAAGIGCVGVETGGFSRHELSEEGALFVYRDAQEAVDQLRTGALATLIAR